jgi:hypothetical protein
MCLDCELRWPAVESAAMALLVGSSSCLMDFIQLAKAVAQHQPWPEPRLRSPPRHGLQMARSLTASARSPGARKSAKSDGLTEHAGQFVGGRVETVGRSVGHRVHRAQAGDKNQRQHDRVLNSGWTIFFTQQFFQEVHHGSYSIACCQRGFTSCAGMTRTASSGQLPHDKISLPFRKSNLRP